MIYLRKVPKRNQDSKLLLQKIQEKLKQRRKYPGSMFSQPRS